jgi:hypothetical protein
MNQTPLVAAIAHALYAARKRNPTISNVELARIAIETIDGRRIYYRFDAETKQLVAFCPKERAA